MMAKKTVPQIGDIFSIIIDNDFTVYFQYIFNDYTQICPNVIRVFRRRFPIDHVFNKDEVINSGVLFYVHAAIEHGINMKIWQKVTNTSVDDIIYKDIIFGEGIAKTEYFTEEKGLNNDPLSHWSIWTLSQQKKYIGTLPPDMIDKVEIGRPFTYRSIIERIKLGYYTKSIPEYDILKRKPHAFVHSFLRKHEKLDTRQHYWHFIGDMLLEEIILENVKSIRYSKVPSFGVTIIHDDMKFWEINWEERDFITREEFEKLWEGC